MMQQCFACETWLASSSLLSFSPISSNQSTCLAQLIFCDNHLSGLMFNHRTPQNATGAIMPCHAMPCYAALSVLGLDFHVYLSSMARTCACTHEHLSWLV